MNLAGKSILFRLSPEGDLALRDVFPSGVLFSAYVKEQDDLGLWIALQEEAATDQLPVRVMLLKWHYFSTAVIDFEAETPGMRERPGFR